MQAARVSAHAITGMIIFNFDINVLSKYFYSGL